MIHQLFYIDPI